jgi:ABC-type transporter Mla MlaB component
LAASASTIVFALNGPIAPKEVRWMCERVRSLLQSSGDEYVLCDVAAVTEPDAGTVEALARLQLTAQRLGRRILLLDASAELRELLDLAGLSDVVPRLENQACSAIPHRPDGSQEG